MVTIDFKGNKLHLEILGKFEDGSPALQLTDTEYGEPYARLSFCAHDGVNVYPASQDCIWLKDWAENKDLARFMIDEGYFEWTGKEIPSGFVTYKEAIITEKTWRILEN